MLDAQTRLVAAMAYGEASAKDIKEEMFAIASVLVRQRDARGYKDMSSFVQRERTYSFVVGDGNPRYAKLLKASEADIQKDAGMRAAVAAAENALANGQDLSNGGWFWDGADIKTNYRNHFKVRHGIRFTNPLHNIYGIEESSKVVVLYKTTKLRDKKTGKVSVQKEEVGRYDHVYESTAAYGGTIFWRHAKDYMTLTKAKEYK